MVTDRYCLRGFVAQGDVQEVTAIRAFDQHGGGRMTVRQRLPLMRPQPRSEPLARVEQGQAERPVALAEGKDTRVVVDAGRVERGIGAVLHLEVGTHAGDGADGEIGGQAEQVPDLAVASVLQDDLICRFLTPGDNGDVVTSVGERLERGVDLGRLFRGGGQLAHDSYYRFHVDNCITCDLSNKVSSQTNAG